MEKYIAELVWEGVVIKKIPLQNFVNTIQICKSSSINLNVFELTTIPSDVIDVDIMQFKFKDVSKHQPNCLIYEFSRYIIRPSEIDDKPLNLGFAEPDGKVNLEHLKKKFKMGLNLKNLLLRFYQK